MLGHVTAKPCHILCFLYKRKAMVCDGLFDLVSSWDNPISTGFSIVGKGEKSDVYGHCLNFKSCMYLRL